MPDMYDGTLRSNVRHWPVEVSRACRTASPRKWWCWGSIVPSQRLVFDRYRGRLPNLERLMSRGVWGNLRSCDPPITVPAWSVMMSSKDPGTLGIYGFRNRSDHSYDKMAFATGTAVKEPRLGRAGPGRKEGHRPGRARHLPAAAGEWLAGWLLPYAEHRE